MLFYHRLIYLIVFVLFYSSAISAPRLSPDNIAGVTKINAEQLIELVTAEDNIHLIDSRINTDRGHGFIEGSINLTDTDTNCESLQALLPDRDTVVVFYCNGPKCGRSAAASRQALACGYKHIYWFRGGFDEWLSKDYPVILE